MIANFPRRSWALPSYYKIYLRGCENKPKKKKPRVRAFSLWFVVSRGCDACEDSKTLRAKIHYQSQVKQEVKLWLKLLFAAVAGWLVELSFSYPEGPRRPPHLFSSHDGWSALKEVWVMRAMPCNLASCYTRGCQEKQSLLSWGGERPWEERMLRTHKTFARVLPKICLVLASSGVNMQSLLKAQSWPDVWMHFLLAGLPVSGRGAG